MARPTDHLLKLRESIALPPYPELGDIESAILGHNPDLAQKVTEAVAGKASLIDCLALSDWLKDSSDDAIRANHDVETAYILARRGILVMRLMLEKHPGWKGRNAEEERTLAKTRKRYTRRLTNLEESAAALQEMLGANNNRRHSSSSDESDVCRTPPAMPAVNIHYSSPLAKRAASLVFSDDSSDRNQEFGNFPLAKDRRPAVFTAPPSVRKGYSHGKDGRFVDRAASFYSEVASVHDFPGPAPGEPGILRSDDDVASEPIQMPRFPSTYSQLVKALPSPIAPPMTSPPVLPHPESTKHRLPSSYSQLERSSMFKSPLAQTFNGISSRERVSQGLAPIEEQSVSSNNTSKSFAEFGVHVVEPTPTPSPSARRLKPLPATPNAHFTELNYINQHPVTAHAQSPHGQVETQIESNDTRKERRKGSLPLCSPPRRPIPLQSTGDKITQNLTAHPRMTNAQERPRNTMKSDTCIRVSRASTPSNVESEVVSLKSDAYSVVSVPGYRPRRCDTADTEVRLASGSDDGVATVPPPPETIGSADGPPTIRRQALKSTKPRTRGWREAYVGQSYFSDPSDVSDTEPPRKEQSPSAGSSKLRPLDIPSSSPAMASESNRAQTPLSPDLMVNISSNDFMTRQPAAAPIPDDAEFWQTLPPYNNIPKKTKAGKTAGHVDRTSCTAVVGTPYGRLPLTAHEGLGGRHLRRRVRIQPQLQDSDRSLDEAGIEPAVLSKSTPKLSMSKEQVDVVVVPSMSREVRRRPPRAGRTVVELDVRVARDARILGDLERMRRGMEERPWKATTTVPADLI